MSLLDIALATFLGVLVLIGFKRGLINTIFPLAGVVLAIFLAFHFYSALANSLSQWIENPSYAKIIAFVIVFTLVMAGILALASLLKLILSVFLLGWVDRLSGAFFGLAIGGLIPAIVLALLTKLHLSAVESTIQGSNLANFLLNSLNSALSFLPAEYDAIRQFFG